MQLRKGCNHPYLFENVEGDGTDEFGEHLINTSGKMILVDKLITKIRAQKEQAILFSGMTAMLNILQDYCVLRGIPYCHLDGNTELEDREE